MPLAVQQATAFLCSADGNIDRAAAGAIRIHRWPSILTRRRSREEDRTCQRPKECIVARRGLGLLARIWRVLSLFLSRGSSQATKPLSCRVRLSSKCSKVTEVCRLTTGARCRTRCPCCRLEIVLLLEALQPMLKRRSPEGLRLTLSSRRAEGKVFCEELRGGHCESFCPACRRPVVCSLEHIRGTREATCPSLDHKGTKRRRSAGRWCLSPETRRLRHPAAGGEESASEA
ncbi:unnamed protein product, partial [Polarella glacialis]